MAGKKVELGEVSASSGEFVALKIVVTENNSTTKYDALSMNNLGYSLSGKNYPVQADNGKLYVNVPWTDTLYTLPAATSSTLGGIEVGSSGSSISSYQAAGSTHKYYKVNLDSNNLAYVDVPWTDTTYSQATDSALGLVKVAGSSASSVATAPGTTTSRYYGVGIDSNGKLYVNIPWTDTNNWPGSYDSSTDTYTL